MTSDGSPGSLERSERSQGLGPAAATRSARGALGRFSHSGARRREAPARRRRGWSSARQPSLRWAESQRVCSSTKSSTREEGRANAGSRPDAVATNSDDVSATLFGVFFAAGLSSCAVRIFATPGGVPTRLFTHRKHFQVTMGLTPRHPPTAGVRFFPPRTLGTLGNGETAGSLAAPPPAPLLPAPPRDGALRAAPRNLADARAPPLVHRARTSPATRRPLHRRATRRTGRPVRPRDTADASAPSPGDDACCAELRALNDARCFCREPFLTLPQPQQSALVPALANGPRRCGVNTRVGDRCLSVVRPEPRPPPAPSPRRNPDRNPSQYQYWYLHPRGRC